MVVANSSGHCQAVMPWVKTQRRNSRGQRLYRSPSGRMFTLKQIRTYKATHGFSRPVRPKRKR
jgi:hypothetical protein